MKKHFVLFLSFYFCLLSKGEVIGNINYNSKSYFVDVLTRKTKAEVWFRVEKKASTKDDMLMATITIGNVDWKYYAQLSCKAKELTDGGKTITGCLALVGSVFCAASSVATEGTTAVACTTVWNYTVETGAADCIIGISGIIANHLGKQKEWNASGIVANLSNGKLVTAIDNAIDLMCEYVKNPDKK